jgi:hypothetical protein
MMKRSAFRVAKLAALCGGLALALASYFSAAASRGGAAELLTGAQGGDAAEFFEKRVRPLLVAKCQMCHSAEAATSGLDMSSAEAFRRGGASGPLVNAENPEASLLLKVISYDGILKMPPMGKLKDEEIATLTAWVKMGAPWPGAGPVVAEAKGKSWVPPTSTRAFTEEEKKFWAFQPMARPAPPEVKNEAWVKSPVDRFILAELEKKGLQPAPPADKLTLLRRATYDLTGLPPTEREISDFVNDKSAEAFKKVVERLLASPRYGEKWGRHWLDVARYADSTGNDEDHRYPYAYRYRDYVIEAFNRDLPYDQFVREQIAGDLLPSPDGAEVNRRGIVATGFLALGPKALAQQDKKRMLYDVYDEQVDVTTKAFLGLTVSCARCHNHKFDPVLTKDYYSLINIFAGTRSFKDPKTFVATLLNKPLVPKAEYAAYEEKLKAHQEAAKKLKFAREEILDAKKEIVAARLCAQMADYMLAARKVYEGGAKVEDIAKSQRLDAGVLKKWAEYLKPGAPRQHLLEWQEAAPDKLAEVARGYQQRFEARLKEWRPKVAAWRAKYKQALAENKPLPDKPEFVEGEDRFFAQVYLNQKGPLAVADTEEKSFTADEWKELARLKREAEALKKQAPPEPDFASAVEEGEPVAQKVFVRGDHNSEGEDAPKAVPAILRAHTAEPEFKHGSGRRELAEWLTQAEHPLTARVMANRVWHWHFGEGLVRTPDNFGKTGEKPTHPALLDFIAREFVRGGWSVKALHRTLMLSSTYQMSSGARPEALAADPENRLFSRFNRRRLTVEEMRDALLFVDGTIDLTMGGTLQKGTGTDGENSNDRLSLSPEKLTRRTVYVPLRRANLPSLLNLFDFGDATALNGKRQLTNVATQALFAMNSEFVAARATNVAKSLLKDKSATDAGRVGRAYLLILNRPASEDEVRQAASYVAGFREKFAGKGADEKAWQSLCRVLMASNGFTYVD